MRTKWDIDSVKEYYKSYGYEVLEDTYVNNKYPMKIKTQEGYIARLCLSNLQQGQGVFIFGQNNEYTLQNIQHFINLHNSKTKLLSQTFEGNGNDLEFRCGCGNIFNRTWGNMKHFEAFNCPQCAIYKRSVKERLDFDKVAKLFEQNNLILLSDESQYINNGTKLNALTTEGYKVSISYNNLSKKKKPTVLGLNYNKKFFDYNMDLWLRNNNIECEYLEVVDEKQKSIACKCSCGKIFTSPYIRVARGQKTRCEVCTSKQSHYSLLTENWLIEHEINYVKEKRYSQCKDKQTLPFDFYLTDYNILIEVDGEQHYRTNSKYFSSLIKQHDLVKDKFCKDNYIKLVRVPYWEYYSNQYQETLFLNILQA